MTAPKDKDTNAADKDAAKGTAGSGGADQADTSKTESAKDGAKETHVLHGDGKDGSAGARTGAAAKSTIVDRSQDVRTNRTDRDAQIARADAHMKAASNPKSDHAKTLAQKAKDEEAIYEGIKDAPPPTGKAFNTVTPSRIDGDGERHWT